MTRYNIALVFAAVWGMCSAGVTHAEQLAATSRSNIKNDLNYLMYTPDDYASSPTKRTHSSCGFTAAIRVGLISRKLDRAEFRS